jgi:ribonuclease HIII
MSQKNLFVTELGNEKKDALKRLLEEQGFALGKAPYTHFTGKKKGVSVSFYESGKLVVQGKELKDFIEFYLEPQILESFDFTYKDLNVDKTPRIGADESGKGDYFGPLVTAAVFSDAKGIDTLLELGVADSKKLSDKRILSLAINIKKKFQWEAFTLKPKGYNSTYEKFQNLNSMLAWAHSKSIGTLYANTQAPKIIVDQFAKPEVLEKFLKRNNDTYELIQVPRAEEDPVVAAASIIARAEFLKQLDSMGKDFGMTFPKGASKLTIEAGIKYIEVRGKKELYQVAKLHFQTTQKIISS